jgi:hypothetical protein
MDVDGPIRLRIDGEKERNFASVPDAVAACRTYFMGGGRGACKIAQDHLIYTVEVSQDWDGCGLP